MPTPHCTPSATCGELMTSPSSTIATRRLGSPRRVAGRGARSAPPTRGRRRRWKSIVDEARGAGLRVDGRRWRRSTPSPVRAAGPSRIGWPLSSRTVCSAVGSNSRPRPPRPSAAAEGVGRRWARRWARSAAAVRRGVARQRGAARPGDGAGARRAGGGAWRRRRRGGRRCLGRRHRGEQRGRLGVGCRPTTWLGSPGPSTGWKVSWAVWPMASAAAAASCTPGSSTMIRFSPERASVGSETPSASTRRRSTSSARSVASASASRGRASPGSRG